MHVARISGGRHGTPEELRGMENASKQAAKDVAMVEPDVVVYGCTSGSFFEGPEWNRRICEQLTGIAGAPTVTTAGAMVEAMMAGGHKKVDVVTPYVELTNERLKQFLKAHDIEVPTLATFDMLDMFDHAKIEPGEIYRKVKEITTPQVGRGVRRLHAVARDGGAGQPRARPRQAGLFGGPGERLGRRTGDGDRPRHHGLRQPAAPAVRARSYGDPKERAADGLVNLAGLRNLRGHASHGRITILHVRVMAGGSLLFILSAGSPQSVPRRGFYRDDLIHDDRRQNERRQN